MKQADGITDARELEVIFDVLELLPGAISLPALDSMRSEARALLTSDTAPILTNTPVPKTEVAQPGRPGFLGRLMAALRR